MSYVLRTLVITAAFLVYSVDDLYAFELHQQALVPTYTLECTILRPGPVTALVPFCEI